MPQVLLIEPDRPLAEIYTQAVKKAGYKVTVCSGAQSAIMSADEQTPDIVILEIQLVEHSGIEFLYEFRSYEEWQKVPVLVQSIVPLSEFFSSQALLYDQLGVRAYLYKPLSNIRDLISGINKLAPITA